MKTRFSYGLCMLLCLLWLSACRQISNSADSSSHEEDPCAQEKAKAILWVDYQRGRKIADGTTIRTVKVLADVHADGSLKIISFCKKQPVEVMSYLLKRVEVYRIRQEMFEGNYIQPGEQYLQLRYLPEKIK